MCVVCCCVWPRGKRKHFEDITTFNSPSNDPHILTGRRISLATLWSKGRRAHLTLRNVSESVRSVLCNRKNHLQPRHPLPNNNFLVPLSLSLTLIISYISVMSLPHPGAGAFKTALAWWCGFRVLLSQIIFTITQGTNDCVTCTCDTMILSTNGVG